ncbi:hypothetical protein F5X96DRAFT_631706 [Biscogniauxia mediterranea]|nr:hypothetical protein F5X96DRAFT_631706 [Biscogniauxia mediterranea]
MYNNAGYFCCEEGQIGYNNGNTDGCVSSTADIPDGASRLAVVAQALSSTTSPTSTTSQSDSNCTPSAGVIAGSVIGGVALAVILLSSWLLYQRGNRRGTATANPQILAGPHNNEKGAPGRTEIDGNSRSELPHDGATTAGRTYELS